MAKRGPKSSFNEKLSDTFARLTADGKTLEEIAEVLGVSTRTLNRWMGKHQELRLAVRESRLIADELVEAALYSRATGYSHPETKLFAHEGIVLSKEDVIKHYPPDTQAAMFWLRNRQPARWKEKTEGDVTVNVDATQKLTDEQLDAKLEALLAKRKAQP